MIDFEVKDMGGNVRFIAHIDCNKNSNISLKKRLAVMYAYENQNDIDLCGIDLHGANLLNADLHGANLHAIDLHEANLHNVNLSNAYLHSANLSNANLSNANLSNANLSNAYLHSANLSNANLSNANLSNANLSNADLCGANFDFSTWPLWCGSFNVKADDRLVSQLFYHVARLDITNCSDKIKEIYKSIFESENGKELANTFCQFRNDIKPIK